MFPCLKACKAVGDCVTASKTITLVPVNDKPVVSPSSPTFSYTEMSGKVYVDDALTVTDVDSDTLSQVSVQISGVYDNGNDVLTVDPATLTGSGGANYVLSPSWDVSMGTMTVVNTSGTAPPSAWQQVLRGVQYENPSRNPAPGDRLFLFKAYDGSEWSDAMTRTMTFNIINQIPNVTVSNKLHTYAEQDAPEPVKYLVVDADLVVMDEDTPMMASATVRVAVGHEVNKDLLRFNATSNITGSFDNASGTLTMNGTARASEYQSVLRTVEYYNAAPNAAAGTRQIEFKVTDGEGGTSDAATVNITFVPENDAPEIEIVTAPPLVWTRQIVNLQPTLNLTDKDDLTLANATVTLVNGQGFDPAIDSLTYNTVDGEHDAISVSYDSGQGKLVLSGPGLLAAYQSLLRTVNLVQSSAAETSISPNRMRREIKFEVTDLAGASASDTRVYYNSELMFFPTISSITPIGTTGGRITIRGTGFGLKTPKLVTLVDVGSGECANVTVTVENTTMECDAPAGSGKNLRAYIKVPFKRSINFNVFSYLPPTVSSITSIGTLGGTVTITGTNFGLQGGFALTQAANGDQGLFGVTIGGKECANAEVVDDTGTKITCRAAEHVGKDLNVTVCVSRQCGTNAGSFDYTAPTITGSFNASVFGYYAYITGTNLGPVGIHDYITVSFQATTGGNTFTCSSTEVTVASAQIKCMVPAMQLVAAANTNDASKTYTVTLSVSNQDFTGTGIFTYEKPVITSATTASLYGGQITIQGRNFGAAGTAATLEVKDPSNANFFTVNVGNTPTGQTKPSVTVLHTTATTWISSYTTGGLTTMTPEISITIGGFKSTAFSNFAYEGPVIDNTQSLVGSQFGDCITSNNAVPCNENFTITGRNFGPAGTRNASIVSENYMSITINDLLPCANGDCSSRSNTGLPANTNVGTSIQTFEVISDTELTFTRTAARPENHLTGQNLKVTVYLYCHGTTVSTCQDSGTTGAGIFNYTGPSVTGFMDVASAPSSAGGIITITGIRFGASYGANAGFFNTSTYPSAGVEICSRKSSCEDKVYCTKPAVINDTHITCEVNEATLTTGIAMKTQINVTLGTLHSGTTGAGLFTYGIPKVDAGLTAPAAGGTLTVTGTGFGAKGNNNINVTVVDGQQSARACTNVVVESHTKLTCDQSSGTGTSLDVIVTVFSKDGDSLQTAAGNAAFSYARPTVTSVTSCPTSGGIIGVYGTNFGYNRPGNPSTDFVEIQSTATSNVKLDNITIFNDTYLEVDFSAEDAFVPAVAPPHNVTVTLDTQVSDSKGKFYFTSPSVTGIAKRPNWIGIDTVLITGTSFGAIGTRQISNNLVVTISDIRDEDITACEVSVAHTQIRCTTTCATVCNATESNTTRLKYRDVQVEVGLPIAAGEPNAGTRLNSGTTGNGKLKLIGPYITQVSGATSKQVNKLSFFPASDKLKVTGRNFGKMDATDGSTLDFIGVCAENTISKCSPYPFVISTNSYEDFKIPVSLNKSIDDTEVEATILKEYGNSFSVMVMIAGVTSDDAQNVDAVGTGTAVTDAVGNGLLDFIGPEITDVATGHGILTDGTQGMANKTQVSVSGLRLGPAASPNIKEIRWDNSSFSNLVCADGCFLLNSNARVSTLDTELKFDVPEGVGTATFKVVINNGIGDMTSETAAFTYTAPNITDVSIVAAGGGTLTITGTSFGPAGSAYLKDLLVGAVTCESATVVVAHKKIECTMPAGTGLNKDVNFKIGGLAATGGTGKFSYKQPSLTGVATINTNQRSSPHSVINASYPSIGFAPWIVLTGTHFGPLSTTYEYIRVGYDLSGTHSVYDSGYANCNNILVTVADTEIQCLLGSSTLGSGSGKNYDVLMKLPSGANNGPGTGSNTYADKFSYAIPTVTNATSVTFFGGVTTTITGTNFGCVSSSYANNDCVLPTGNDQTVTVTIGGKTCASPNVTVAHTKISCVTPEMTGSGVNLIDIPLVVTVEGQESVNAKYTYGGPLITAVTEASMYGGLVTVTGTNFGPLTDCTNDASCHIQLVRIDTLDLVSSDVQAMVTVAGTEVQFYAPAGDVNEPLNLTLNIAGRETGTSGDGLFIYSGPKITSVDGGSTAGGMTTIHGNNFGPVGQGKLSKVEIRGDDSITELCLNANVTIENVQIQCVSFPGFGTKKDIFVTIGGTTVTGSRLFNYAPAEVTSADPDFSKEGTVVTFAGDSFGTDATKIKAYVDDIECTGVTVVQDHYKISCIIPKSIGGFRPVRVDVEGIVGNAKPVYSYPLPQVTHIQATLPSEGSPPPVTIYGLNFGGVFSALASSNATQSPQIVNVTIGSAVCTNPQVVVENGISGIIICNVPKALATDYGGSFNLADWNHTAGGNMSVVVNLVGGQNSGSTGLNKFAFNQPAVTGIEPGNGKMGDFITVSGNDLGDEGKAVKVYINGRLSPQVIIVTAESSFRFKVPVGTGINNEIIIMINGRNATYSGVPALFNYDKPTLLPDETVPPSSTRGGLTTFKGTGFGPVGNAFVDSVQIEGVGKCFNANVTVDDTELTCTALGGQGRDIITIVTVDGLESEPTAAFRFPVPIVTSVKIENNETLLRAGELIYIKGSNFGTDGNKITVMIRGDLDKKGFGVECPLKEANVNTLDPVDSITCTAPIMVGSNVSVIVDVAGLENENTDELNKVSYINPMVATVSPVKTNGGEAAGMVTITGANFGPNGTFYKADISISLGGIPCNTPVVTETNNTNGKIECKPGAGVGKELDVVVTINGAGSGTSGAKKFSFLPPKVINIDAPPTIGGRVTVYGENFGPAGTSANAIVYSDQQCVNGITGSSFMGASGCTPVEGIGNPSEVAVVDHETITFTFPAGVGGGYDLLIEVGDQTSGVSGDNKFSYHVPIVQKVVPNVQPLALPVSDTRITITGSNFGTDETAIRVSIGERYSNGAIRLYTFRNTQTGEVTGEGEIIVTIPFNAGNNLPVRVHVGALSSVPSTAAVKTDVFSYNTPFINYTTPVPTEGSAESNVLMSIYGFNFGPVGNISSVIVGDTECTEAKIVVEDRVITCQQPAGMGKDLDVFVRISPNDDTSSQSTGRKKFSYEAPVITDISPKSAKVGEYVTVTGRNFGLASELNIGLTQDVIRLCVVGPNDENWCNDYNEMQKQHTKFYAKVPVGFGSNRALRVEVKGLMGVKTSSILFSYAGPQVNSALDVPTDGGVLRVIGKQFGLKGTTAFDGVTVRDAKQRLLTCKAPRVVVDDTAVECDLPAGSGQGLEVQVSVGGQNSTWEKVFSYAAPLITNIEPAVAAAGETVTVSGRNFGVNASEIVLSMEKDIAGGGGKYELPISSAAASITLIESHTKFSFVIPLGVGPDLTLLTSLPKYGNDTTFMRTSTSAKSTDNSSTTFSFKAPIVSAVSSVSTAGGVATITGNNFGPVGSAFVNSVVMGEGAMTLVCSDANVTVANTQATCKIGSGSGPSYKVTMIVFNQTNVDSTRFSYSAPVIDSVQPSEASPGAVVTVTGKNFGVTVTDISVKLGVYDCKDVSKLTNHTRLACTVPAAEGKTLHAVATVNGLSGSSVGAATFTFTKSGCNVETAVNYDVNATVNDGSCNILGCMNNESFNFNPEANKDDGMCEEFPVTVSMRIQADYAEYVANKPMFEDKFVAEISRNLNISASRIQILNVTAGSIVFTFKIFDHGSGGIRVAEASKKLEDQVKLNTWESEFVLLELEVIGSTTGPIVTKASEPAISLKSMIGVGIGFGILVVWLFLWRRCMTTVATRCFAAKDDDDGLVEVQVYSNPMSKDMLPASYAKYGKLGAAYE